MAGSGRSRFCAGGSKSDGVKERRRRYAKEKGARDHTSLRTRIKGRLQSRNEGLASAGLSIFCKHSKQTAVKATAQNKVRLRINRRI